MSIVWKDIPNFEGVYQAASDGGIRSLDRIDSKGRRRTGRVLKQKVRRDGYAEVVLQKSGEKQTSHLAHRLVLSAFRGSSELHCNHKDGITLNNSIENLEWVTHKQNVKHAMEVLGRHQGEKHEGSKLKLSDVLAMRKTYSGTKGQIAELAREYGVHFMTASNVVHGKTWKRITP